MSNDQWGQNPGMNGNQPSQPDWGSQPTQQFGQPLGQPSAPQPTQQFGAVPPASQPSAPQWGAQQPQQQWGAPAGQPSYGSTPPPKKGIPVWAWIVGALVILGLVVGILFATGVFGKKEETKSSTSTTSTSTSASPTTTSTSTTSTSTSTTSKPTTTATTSKPTTTSTTSKPTSSTSTKGGALPPASSKDIQSITYPATVGAYKTVGAPTAGSSSDQIDIQIYMNDSSDMIGVVRSTNPAETYTAAFSSPVTKGNVTCGMAIGYPMCVANVSGGSLVVMDMKTGNTTTDNAMSFMTEFVTKI